MITRVLHPKERFWTIRLALLQKNQQFIQGVPNDYFDWLKSEEVVVGH